VPEIKILIVANGVEATHEYKRALSNLASEYDAAETFYEAQSRAKETAYNGMLFDLVTLVRSSKEEKLIAYSLINLFPVIRVKYEKRSREIKLAPLEESLSTDPQTALQLFIEDKCQSFPARFLSRYQRVEAFLHVLLCPTDQFSESGSAQTFTVNISRGGAFLHATQPFQRGDTVWLQFKELADPAPIKTRVCWRIEWGSESRSIPGIGVEFETLSESQREEIHSFCNERETKTELNPAFRG
jgi:Tfp pilus assembly protein PilZ